jgi:hypothetical protein
VRAESHVFDTIVEPKPFGPNPCKQDPFAKTALPISPTAGAVTVAARADASSKDRATPGATTTAPSWRRSNDRKTSD